MKDTLGKGQNVAGRGERHARKVSERQTGRE